MHGSRQPFGAGNKGWVANVTGALRENPQTADELRHTLVAVSPGRGERQRLRLFELGCAAANKLFVGSVGDEYICPICAVAYPRTALDDRTLSIEHAPPESLGGTFVGLTCTPCNNTAGADLDAEMEKAEAHMDFAAGPGSRPIRGAIEREGETIHGNIQRSGDGFLFLGVPKANHSDAPRRQEQISEEWIEGEPVGKTINFTSRETWRTGRAAVGWLRAGYLCAWSALGYRYALSDGLDPVRYQLVNPDDDRLPFMSATNPLSSDARDGVTVWIIREPDWLRSVAVVMGRHTVHFPYGPEPDFFQRLADEFATRKQAPGPGDFEYTGTRVTWSGSPTFYLDHAEPTK